MRIPIRNIYYLLIYAWDVLPEADLVKADSLEETRLPDLFARVLKNGVSRLLKRGLDRGYLPSVEAIPGIRGKLRIPESIKDLSFLRGQAVCEFDEHSHNVPHNQIIKATMKRLSRLPELDDGLREDLIGIGRRLHEVKDIRLSSAAFRSVQLHSNIRWYGFLLRVCRLLYENLLVNERTGEAVFRDFVRDERQMAEVFERFIRNFYHREQANFSVGRDHLNWQMTVGSEEAIGFLPKMRTDVCLKSSSRQIVLDAKYYRETLQSYFEGRSLRSGHLYQLFAYLQNLSARDGLKSPWEGILLYPTVSEVQDLRYDMHGHKVRICTLDLNRPWPDIHQQLISLLAA